MEDLRYPVGKFQPLESITDQERAGCIRDITSAPSILRSTVTGMSDAQLGTQYRPDGWTVRQVVHHLADSHLNAYIRFKLALTENEPAVKSYNERLWAELVDARSAEIEPSLGLLESLHVRWIVLLNAMKPDDFNKTLVHPQSGLMKLHRLLQLYAWHGRHHTAQITTLKARMNWK